MLNVKKKIAEDLKRIVKDLTGQDIIPILEHPKDQRHGDYSSNIAMTIFSSSKFKVQSSKFRTPLDLAKEIVGEFKIQSSESRVIEKAEALPPGFINLWLSKEYLTTLMIHVIKVKDEYGKSKKLKNKKIMLEFADPNPFKEFHIGHLRNITLGESYARLLEVQGATVWRVNYQGDVGMHVAKALCGLLQISNLKSQISKLEKKSFGERARFLGEAYTAGSKAYEEDEQVKKEIQLINIKIYKSDPEIRKVWEKGRKWSLDYFETIYKRVGTTYNRYYFESEVAKEGRKIVLRHVADGIFEKSNRAIIFRGEKHGLHNRVFVTKENYATYEAKDMALARIKYKDFHYDKSIIITAHEQAPYFKVVLAAMKLVSPDLAAKTIHDSFGFVSLKDTKMSSRLGNIVIGKWLLDEAKRRIREQYKEMDEDTAEKVAVGAVKYSMLKFSKESDMSFSFDESISLEGNSGPYLQYTFARTQSVLAKVKSQSPIQSGTKVKSNWKLESEELALLRAIYRFPEVVEQAAEKFTPNLLCDYLFDLSQKFNLFYQKVPILRPIIHDKARDHRLREFRLGLTQAVGQVIKNGLHVLGIKVPTKM